MDLHNLTTKYKKLTIGKGSRKKSYFLNGIAIKALPPPELNDRRIFVVVVVIVNLKRAGNRLCLFFLHPIFGLK